MLQFNNLTLFYVINKRKNKKMNMIFILFHKMDGFMNGMKVKGKED